MKIKLLVALFVLSVLFSHAQESGNIKPGEEVKIDWDKGPGLFFFEEFWETAYPKIVREVGEEKAKLIKEYPCFKRWPSEMRPTGTDSAAVREYNSRLNKLHILKVMTLTYEANGKTHTFEIVEVPYHLNKDWNPAVK